MGASPVENRTKRGGAAGTWILPAALAVFLLMLLAASPLRDGLIYAPIGPVAEIETDGVIPVSGLQRLDLNLAEAEELEQLPGIGASLARRIVRWRRENGGFASVDQLAEVEGIGAAKLEAILPYITLGEGP